MSGQLKRCYFAKLKCAVHGEFSTRTAEPIDPNKTPHCPDCRTELIEQVLGRTIQSIPYISKPRLKLTADRNAVFSDKAPLRKRARTT